MLATKGVSMHLANRSEPPSKSKTTSQKEEMEKYNCASFLLRMGDFGKIDKFVYFFSLFDFFFLLM